MKKLSKERLRPIRDEVYHIIRKDIIHGVYKPGDRLQEEQLAEQLGTSRTPVREALRKLEVERFVDYTPHKGTVVTDVSSDEVEELYKVRALVESLIVKKAALNATNEDIKKLRKSLEVCEKCTDIDDTLDCVEEFNNILFETANSKFLEDINRRIREILQRVLVSNHMNPERHKIAHEEHKKIVDAIEAHDVDLAERYTIEHLSNAPREYKIYK